MPALTPSQIRALQRLTSVTQALADQRDRGPLTFHLFRNGFANGVVQLGGSNGRRWFEGHVSVSYLITRRGAVRPGCGCDDSYRALARPARSTTP